MKTSFLKTLTQLCNPSVIAQLCQWTPLGMDVCSQTNDGCPCCACPQVSSLEQQLERTRATLQGEARNRERDAQEKDEELQEMKQQNIQLSESVG